MEDGGDTKKMKTKKMSDILFFIFFSNLKIELILSISIK